MADERFRFDDGASYERMMGRWSQLAGEIFLDWLAPPPGLHWIDVGCGNGAFTELLVRRTAPGAAQGVDPSEAQLSFARARPGAQGAGFRRGDAQALPFPDDSFDAAVMALVIFFVPEPARGVAEMRRVVRPGGLVATYAWDLLGGGFPLQAMHAEMSVLGVKPQQPPSPEASRTEVMRDLWKGAGLDSVETREITVQRTFADFDEYWAIALTSPGIAPKAAAMPVGDVELLRSAVRARLPADSAGRVTCSARANAVKGRRPR